MKNRKQSPINQEPFFDERGFFRFRPVSSDARKAVLLSSLPLRLMTFFERFESSCSLDCCGISALVFDPPIEWDKRWNFNYDVFKLLQAEVDKATELDAEVIRLKVFQQAFYTDDWLFFLRYLMENMENSKRWK